MPFQSIMYILTYFIIFVNSRDVEIESINHETHANKSAYVAKYIPISRVWRSAQFASYGTFTPNEC